MAESRRYIVTIHRQEDAYRGHLSQGESLQARELTDLQLGPQARINIRGKPYTLEALIQALISYRQDDLRLAYDERGQLDIGRHLYTQIFGPSGPVSFPQQDDPGIDLRIVTEDEHIARLPWVLLNNGSVFLGTTGWSMALARRSPEGIYELPPSPRLLIVAPQPAGVAATRAETHLETLENLLSAADPRHVRGQALRVVETWEAFTQAVAVFQPDVVYYYGHGIGDSHTSRLLFASAQGNRRLDIPIADVAACLRTMPKGPPLLAYVNCCQGDAGGLLGAGNTLGSMIPAVVTNRTIAHIDAAQSQALAFWRSVLLEGQPPHGAVARMQQQLISMGLSFGNERWMTPVLHAHYHTWKANPPTPPHRLEYDPHWRVKLDRVKQFSQVYYLTNQMLREQRPRSLAYIWYGQAGQGVDVFHQRLTVELSERLPGTSLVEFTPEWPPALDNPGAAFTEMLCAAFEVSTLEAIPARIRARNRGVSGRQTLVYVRHQPVQSARLINPVVLKHYLQWWDACFVPLLEPQVFAVLGVSFIVGKPAVFLRALTEQVHLPDLDLPGTVLQILEEMERVSRNDLRDFLRTHNVKLPVQHRDRVLDEILARTNGDYDLTLEALKDLVVRAWAQVEQRTEAGQSASEDYDYS